MDILFVEGNPFYLMAFGGNGEGKFPAHGLRSTHHRFDGEVVRAVQHGRHPGGGYFHFIGKLSALQSKRFHALKDLLNDPEFLEHDFLGEREFAGEEAADVIRCLLCDVNFHG